MHTVFALLCFVVVIHWLIFPYPSGLLHWHCGNLTIAPVPAKQPWWIWINTSCEFIMNDCITTTKQSTTKPCAYFLGYTVYPSFSDICSMIVYQPIVIELIICHMASKILVNIGSGNSVLPATHQAVIWAIARLIVNLTSRSNFQSHWDQKTNYFIKQNAFENVVRKMTAICSGMYRYFYISRPSYIGPTNRTQTTLQWYFHLSYLPTIYVWCSLGK